MERLTARNQSGYAYLVKVKPDEQEVNSPHKNTLQAILDSWERLARYEDTGFEPSEISVLAKELIKLNGEYDRCGNCGMYVYKGETFCSTCGHRIKIFKGEIRD